MAPVCPALTCRNGGNVPVLTFKGTPVPPAFSLTEDPAYALWQKQSGSALWETLRLLMNEPAGDRLHWKE